LVIGKVSITGNTTRFSVTRHKDIEKIQDIFTKYPLNCTKLLNFFDFKKAFELYTSSKIKGENIAQQINDLKYSMNTHRTVFQMPLDFEPRITSY
jgi:plasmid replication initiation protein